MRTLSQLALGTALLVGISTLTATGVVDADNSTPWVQAADYPRFSLAVAAAVGKTLVISSPITLDAHASIPPETQLLFLNGGSILKSADFTLNVQGPLTAPPTPIFSGFGPGEVQLSPNLVGEAVPQWWGAKGDGQTDDTTALQCALDSGCPVIRIPKGRYLLRAPLNLTNRSGIKLIGAGSAEGLGTALVGDTGGVVLDLSGSRHTELRDLDIVSGDTAPSTVGILYARTPQVQFVEFNSLNQVGVFLRSLPWVNNGNGTVAVYNYAAELWRGRNLYLVADTAVAFTGYNAYGILSPFVDLFTGYPSMSQCTIDGVSTLRGLAGPCVLCDNGIGIEILNAYLCGGPVGQPSEGGEPPAPFPYAVKVTGPGFFTHRLTITGHLERVGGWLYTDVNIRNLRLEGTGMGAAAAVHLEPPFGTIVGGEVCVRPLQEPHPMVLLEASGPGAVHDTVLHLVGGQRIVAPGIHFSGNIIRTALSGAEAQAALTLSPQATFLLLAGDGNWLCGPEGHAEGQ